MNVLGKKHDEVMKIKEQQARVFARHEERLKELKSLRQHGDMSKVAEISGLTQSNAVKALGKIGSKNHLVVFNALEQVIKERLESYGHSKA